jgi:inhibitor of KinA
VKFPFRIVPAGDAALVVEFPQRIHPELNACCVAAAGALRARHGAVLRDVVVGYCSVTAYFDPLVVDGAWLQEQLRVLVDQPAEDAATTGAVVDVPVCYGGELGPDLADVARFASCSEAEVIRRHAGRSYRVYLVGFVPGFAYMAEVDSVIAAPRRSSPRTAVPLGSVGIAGGQTGVYPAVTPGGWNLIGRTPVKPYDPGRARPFLFEAGDTVRFHSVSAAEFEALAGSSVAG